MTISWVKISFLSLSLSSLTMKSCLLLLASLTLCLSARLRLKTSRMGLYGGYHGHIPYEPVVAKYEPQFQSYDQDDGSEYDGHFGGGFGSSAPVYETEYSGGYGSYGKSSKPRVYHKKSYEMAPLKSSYSGPKNYRVKVPHEDEPVKVLFLTQPTPVHIQQKHKRGENE